jgi:hypothetical protein
VDGRLMTPALDGAVRLCATIQLVTIGFGLANPAVQNAKAEDIETKQVEYGFENHSSSSDVLNCTLAAYITNFPAPEFVNVRLRVDASYQQNVMFFSITADVGQQLYENGHPSALRSVPIDQADFMSDRFDSLGRLHSTLDKGGCPTANQRSNCVPPATSQLSESTLYDQI